MLTSVDRLELLSLRSLSDWVRVSSCVASGATIEFIPLSTSLNDTSVLSTEAADYAQHHLLTLPILVHHRSQQTCRVGVLFRSDMLSLLVDGKKLCFSCYSELN